MTSRKDAILTATAKAAQVNEDFQDDSRPSFDVQAPLLAWRIPLFYRPIDPLLGATIYPHDGDDDVGVMITTRRPLSVQRFTLAHELGHIVMGHRMKFDLEVGVHYGPDGKPGGIEEVAADTFAAELLAPPVRIAEIAERHGWNAAHLERPETIYQMSLRLGVSFVATVWALVNAKIMTYAKAKPIADAGIPKGLKARLGDPLLESGYPDAWELDNGDYDRVLEAGPEDVFGIHLKEAAASGYQWRVEAPALTKVVEQPRGLRSFQKSAAVGNPTPRDVLFRFPEPGRHRISFVHERPWSRQRSDALALTIDGLGKEGEGQARRQRIAILEGGP